MMGAGFALAPFLLSVSFDALEMADLDPPASPIRAPAAARIARPTFIDVVDAAVPAIEALVRDIVPADADIVAETHFGGSRSNCRQWKDQCRQREQACRKLD